MSVEPALDLRVERLIPHRAPFLFVREILEHDLVAGTLTARAWFGPEPWASGHFPGRPIVPGVLMVEAFLQTGALLGRILAGDGGGSPREGHVAGISKARFLRLVTPPAEMIYIVKLEARLPAMGLMRFTGEALMGGEPVLRASATTHVPGGI
jgi:3-hydroxyacyl-[acyl-carrier-protein] dehydratase